MYNSFVDQIILESDGVFLTGLWFLNSRDDVRHHENYEIKMLPIFEETIKWLDIYFSGNQPKFTPKYKILNLTAFRKDVIDAMLSIKYGETISYNEIALKIAKKKYF